MKDLNRLDFLKPGVQKEARQGPLHVFRRRRKPIEELDQEEGFSSHFKNAHMSIETGSDASQSSAQYSPRTVLARMVILQNFCIFGHQLLFQREPFVFFAFPHRNNCQPNVCKNTEREPLIKTWPPSRLLADTVMGVSFQAMPEMKPLHHLPFFFLCCFSCSRLLRSFSAANLAAAVATAIAA